MFKVSFFFFTSNKVGESKRVYIMFPDMTDPFSEQKEDGYALQKSVWWGRVIAYGSITSVMLGCNAEITIFFFFQRSYSGRLWDTLSSSSQQQHQCWLISTGMWAENLLQTLSLRWDHQSSLSEIGFISTHFSIQHLPYFGVRAAKSSEMEQQDASSAAILKKKSNFVHVGNLQHCGFPQWKTTTPPLALMNQWCGLNLICCWEKWPFKLVFAAMQMCAA